METSKCGPSAAVVTSSFSPLRPGLIHRSLRCDGGNGGRPACARTTCWGAPSSSECSEIPNSSRSVWWASLQRASSITDSPAQPDSQTGTANANSSGADCAGMKAALRNAPLQILSSSTLRSPASHHQSENLGSLVLLSWLWGHISTDLQGHISLLLLDPDLHHSLGAPATVSQDLQELLQYMMEGYSLHQHLCWSHSLHSPSVLSFFSPLSRS